jgi:AcrR family transcriptional regulator
MGQLKKSDRDEVLMKAIPLFWRRGFSDVGLEDLANVTGLNQSELSSEFGTKEDLFVATLRHYYLSRGGTALLVTEPLGWNNIERFLKLVAEGFVGGLKGCFAVNTLRELELLPPEVSSIVAESRAKLIQLFKNNIAAEKTKTTPDILVNVLSVFLSGFCIEQNLTASIDSRVRKIEDFMLVMRSM